MDARQLLGTARRAARDSPAALSSAGRAHRAYRVAAAVTVHQRLCDLGFFRSVDSRLPKLRSFKMPMFIKQIEKAFKEYPKEKLDDLCAMKTRVCVAIVENEGDNNFRLPHRKKKS